MDTPPPSNSRSGVQLKTPKGTRDWVGGELLLRDDMLQKIKEVFQRHGGIPLETPVFERRDILAGKYGEESRLIYDLEDQGGELCSLRYDLTVPFARWLAMRSNVKHIKRYQISKVYRRDQPSLSRGRLREFFQCDFDIAGTYDSMVSDAEIIRIVVEVFRALELDIAIKVNHRRILDGMFAFCGVPTEKVRAVCSAVDKLDKISWEDVKKEMVEEKGLTENVASLIGEYVNFSGTLTEMLGKIRSWGELCDNSEVSAGLADMDLLTSYLEAMGISDKVVFDLSLARGLDYYSGLIYEVTPKEATPDTQVGSIAAGGRYDNLVGMYGKQPIPCVGVSFGVDRIFAILSSRRPKVEDALSRNSDVYIIALGGKDFSGLLQERMKVACKLWDAGIQAEYLPKNKPKLLPQFNASEGAKVGVIVGQDELANGQARVKDLRVLDMDTPQKDRGRLVSLQDLVGEVGKLLIADQPMTGNLIGNQQ